MKPVRTFLFLLCALTAITAIHFFLVVFSGKGLLELDRNTSASSGIWGRRGFSLQWKTTEENNELKLLQNRWKEDTQMQRIMEIYRIESAIFDNPLLQNIPITEFEYDSNADSRILLEDFFVFLLSLRNPDYTHSIRQWYEKPDFWTEPLARNRENFCRILHYGDSQIENDRISSTIRNLFQNDFGGNGTGLIPLFPAAPSRIGLYKSPNWHVSKARKDSRKGNYGVYTANLASPPVMSLVSNRKKESGILRFDIPANKRHPADSRLFIETVVHSDVSDSDLKVSADNQRLEPVSSLSTYGQRRFTFPVPNAAGKAGIELLFGKNHNIYAVSVNDTVGICLDNIAMRGSAGTVFTPNNRRFLTDQYNLLNVGLIIYQFGANAISQTPGTGNDYNYFRMLMLQELSYLRIQMPYIPVIVIGIADTPDPFAPDAENPDLNTIRSIQKEVAFRTGCIYWDLYQAMGGENAMQRWAEAQPALASKDRIHFTARGADMVGRLFYKAMLDAYRSFLLKERKSLMKQRALELQELN